jgi:methanogenic corrinoid protein MtbC1
VRFQSTLLEELERHLHHQGEDLSRFVNAAIDRELHGDERHLRGPSGLHLVPDLDKCAEAYRRALIARDARRARTIVEDAVLRGAELLDVYERVFTPALEDIGDLWALDEISVVQEHFATEVTAQLIAALAPHPRPAPTAGYSAVVGGSPDELHQLGARMVADVLERAGWEVIGLGAATPADALADMVAADGPDLVALSTSTVGRLPGVEQTLAELCALDAPPVVALGGALYRGPVVELVRGWGADIVTSDLRALLLEVGRRFPPA